MYLLIIRPQKKQKKQMEELHNAMEPGDNIMTTGGFYGTILDLCICRNSDKSSKGYGFITFSTIEATKACLNDHSNRLIDVCV